ncbi:MAG: hypothetical protein E6I74_06785 [Chloroflexi bacterium]|nr:MAG: hypothetical protein E6I74_06785 [Chloroflexota bacterium]
MRPIGGGKDGVGSDCPADARTDHLDRGEGGRKDGIQARRRGRRACRRGRRGCGCRRIAGPRRR